MSPIISQHDLFLDETGKKLVGGRIFLLDPDSTNPIDTFTYNADSDSYVVAENPIYINAMSRSPNTYFTNQLTLVRIYQYIGDFDDPRQDDNDSNFRFVREYYAGESVEETVGSAGIVVHGLTELMNVEPPEEGSMSITVVGYWNATDCEAREYIWDPASNESPDGGYIIKSNNADSGRWILKYDHEWLPSTYYGVMPGHEENINVLLSYNDTVGTTQTFKTAGGVHFARGSYSGTITLATTKKLLIDADTQFNRQIQCNSVKVVGSPETAIAAFYFNGEDVEAHSSWFNSIQDFVNCGARYLYIDKVNHFTNTVLSGNAVWTDKVIVGHGRLPISAYTNNARFLVDNCTINGTKIWNSSDYVYFAHMEFHDDWFDISSVDAWDFVNKISARSMSIVRLSLNNFSQIGAYVKALRANGSTMIDLEGRYHNGSLDLSGFTDVRNVEANSISLYLTGSTSYDVTLRNVKANVGFVGRYLTVMDGSDVNFQNQPSASAMWFNDSRVNGSYKWMTPVQVIATDCFWNITLDYATDNETDQAWTYLTNCTIGNNNGFYMKRLVMKNCITDNNAIKIYPYKENDVYKIFASFEDCTFNSNYPIEFTRFETRDGWESQCYECVVNWTFVGNTFMGNTEGIRCRYWANRVGSYWNKPFIKQSTEHTIVYKGNTGNCPDETNRGMSISDGQTYTTEEIHSGSDTYTIYKYNSSYKRCMPSFSSLWWSMGVPNGGMLVKYYNWVNSPYDSLTYDLFVQTAWFMYNRDRDLPTDNGDLFKMSICLFNNYLRIVQRGDGDHNRGIVGHIV